MSKNKQVEQTSIGEGFKVQDVAAPDTEEVTQLKAEITALKETAASQLTVNGQLREEKQQLLTTVAEYESRAAFEASKLTLTAEAAAAVMQAATNGTGYACCSGNVHAKRLNPNLVKLEMPDEKDERLHYVLVTPDSLAFEVIPETD